MAAFCGKGSPHGGGPHQEKSVLKSPGHYHQFDVEDRGFPIGARVYLVEELECRRTTLIGKDTPRGKDCEVGRHHVGTRLLRQQQQPRLCICCIALRQHDADLKKLRIRRRRLAPAEGRNVLLGGTKLALRNEKLGENSPLAGQRQFGQQTR